ncbi:hypothetical protein [Anaerofustis stercorihominis]|uniref:hypothetical protein n=1 Tax=Anaerofustis stercorihominis TaxID=214853 RepID=UPI0039844F4E
MYDCKNGRRSYWNNHCKGHEPSWERLPLGRDYLKVGYYTEIAFPEAEVRFIAINNGVDSNNQQESDLTPFINIFNEFYAKDTSKKIRAVFKAKGESGNPLCTN